MISLNSFKWALLLGSLLAFGGCAKPAPEPHYTLNEAQKRLVSVCKEDYHLDVTVKPAKDTLWIYVPSREPLVDISVPKTATPPATPPPEKKPGKSLALNFLDAAFKGRVLDIQYDIGQVKRYPAQDAGYNYISPEKFQQNLQNVPTALVRVFGDLAPAEQPRFIVIVFADIVKGLEYRMIGYFPDLLRGSTDSTFVEEYRQRIIVDGPQGNAGLINDAAGKNLRPVEITWPEFLKKQILARIRFKYQQSSNPPKPNAVEEILAQVYATVSAYDYKDFDNVRLEDLGNDKTLDFRKEQLSTFAK